MRGWLPAIMLLLLLSGCASAKLPGAAGPAPSDFEIDLTVLAGVENEGIRPIDERTARYVLYPGGDLHCSVGPELTASDAPPYARTLDPAVVDQLWEITAEQVRAGGASTSVANVERARRVEGQLTRLLVVQADGERWQVARTRSIGASDEPVPDRLTRALAALAWRTDEPDVHVLRVPLRYDFGPDPYDRYRNAPAEAARPDEPGDEDESE